jgi:hypothetical protein
MALEDTVTLGEALRIACGAQGRGRAKAFARHRRSRVVRMAHIGLSACEMGRIFRAKTVARLVRNESWKGRWPERFDDALEWLYGRKVENCPAA